MKKILLLIPIILAGCTVVPETRISFNPTTHEIAIKSPKQIAISNLVVEVVGDKAKITIGSYESKNDPAIMTTIAEANAANIRTAVEGGQRLIDLGKKAALGL